MFGPPGLLRAGPVATPPGPRPALVGCAGLILVVSLAALLSPGVRGLRAPDTAAEDREPAGDAEPGSPVKAGRPGTPAGGPGPAADDLEPAG
ncbi:hypothetical protein ACWDWV_11305 [Streptosporangium sandarakinum]